MGSVATLLVRRPDRTAAERMRRHRRRTLHEGEAFYRCKANTVGLENMLKAAGQLRVIEPDRKAIEGALERFIAVLVEEHGRNGA
jgi:hypothetical protein